ncbi:PIG-L family deacetylase [Namhaeicola litoreus]|uniref:PIG-L family deacetylase n=1 Tax=Namhaeicola litoreus TaxID=1052145 RepID=A0ABW3Y4Q2_9FLAO
MQRIYILVILALFFPITFFGQMPKKLSSDEIYKKIEKLNFLGSVLYVAAHPDDENTRMISYFSNELNARSAYLSLTRGDGGQNLIGPEIREQLGLIRTNELLKARSVDGGEQFFTRANDFGYSKNPDETQRIWNREDVLSDVVRIMREYQPDIVINRFDAGSAGRTHGHHTTSAILSSEAFDLINEKNYVVGNSKPWKIKRMFFNTSWWFYGSREKFAEADKSKMMEVNTGTFYPELGLSNNEIAATSRSMHKSQGFGSTGSRGDESEYLQLINGDMPSDPKNIFEGIDTSWNRVEGGKEIGDILNRVQNNYDFKNPSASVPDLLRAHKLISTLKNEHWKVIKKKEIEAIIYACLGLYLEASSETAESTPGEIVKLNIEAINRSRIPVKIENYRVFCEGLQETNALNKTLDQNVSNNFTSEVKIPLNAPYSSPYWLNEKGSLGMYYVEDPENIGKPMGDQTVKVDFLLTIQGSSIHFEKDVIYKYNDPVKGEVYEPFAILPDFTSTIESNVILFNDTSPKEIPVNVMAHKASINGEISLQVPEHWKVEPSSIPIRLNEKGEVKKVSFFVSPPAGQSEGVLQSVIKSGGKEFNQSLTEINYDHIPKQRILFPANAQVVRLNLSMAPKNVAYIKGAGDDVPESLRQIGYRVTELNPEEIGDDLDRFDAIIMGIRAYNIHDELINKQKALLKFVENGGNLIVQYNTSRGLKINGSLAPYDLQLSNDRVTDETSEVRFINPKQSILNYPNQITQKDFEGWVQERGLYFPDQWSNEFTPVFSMNDPGESAKEGSLLIAKYGKGNYIYTGLSFFRELPAGVPGAYKLFVNMISLGDEQKTTAVKQ